MGLAVAPRVVIDFAMSLLQHAQVWMIPVPSHPVPWSHYREGCALEHLVESYKVLKPTRLDLGATTLLMMLKTLPMLMKILVMMLKTLVMVLKPL